jgi:hypothetical protein
MPQPVIDPFQVVQIQQQHRKRMMAALGAAQLALQRVHEFPVIGQPRERVVCGLIADLFFCSLSLRDVQTDSDAPDDFPGRAAQWFQLYFQYPVLSFVLETWRNFQLRIVCI